jgi:hypothetical protein|tara:strand:- start:818 stop:1111 length:294 start_codon:yes stop_codon:yes gene_type:complete
MSNNMSNQAGPQEGIAQGVIVEVSAGLKTQNGPATLFKAIWGENLVGLWSDDRKPSPFLKGLEIGDNVRFHWNDRATEDDHGRTVVNRYFTPLPAAK